MGAAKEETSTDAAADGSDNSVSSIDRNVSSNNNPRNIDRSRRTNYSNNSSSRDSTSSYAGTTVSNSNTRSHSVSTSGGGGCTAENSSSLNESCPRSTSNNNNMSQIEITSSRDRGCNTSNKQVSSPPSTAWNPGDAVKMGKEGEMATVEGRGSKTPAASPVSRSRCPLNWGLYEQFLLVDLQPTEAALSALHLGSKLRSCLDPSAYESLSSLAACTSPAAAAAAATAGSSAAVASDKAFQKLQQNRGLLLSETHIFDPGLAEGDPAKWQPILDFFNNLYPLSVSFLSASAFAPTGSGSSSAPTPFQEKLGAPSRVQASSPASAAFLTAKEQHFSLTGPSLQQGPAACMRSCAAIDWESLRKFYATLHAAGRSAAAKGFDALSAMTERIQQLCDWLQGRVDCLLYPCQLRFILVLLECPFNEEDEKCSMPLLEVVRTVSMLKDEARQILVNWYESVPTSSLRMHLENIQQMITLRVLAYPDVNALRDGFSRPLRHALHALHILYAGNNRRRLRMEERALIRRKRRRHGMSQARAQHRQPSVSARSAPSFPGGPASEDPAAALRDPVGGEGATQQREQQLQAPQAKEEEQEEGRQRQTGDPPAATMASSATAAVGKEEKPEIDVSVGASAAASTGASAAAVTGETAAAAPPEVEMEAAQEGDLYQGDVEEDDEEESEASSAEAVPIPFEEFQNDALNFQQDVQRHDFAQWLQWRRSLLVSEERDSAGAVDLVSAMRVRCSRARAAAARGGRSTTASSANISNSDSSSSSSDRSSRGSGGGNLGSNEGHSRRSSSVHVSRGVSTNDSGTSMRLRGVQTSGGSEGEETVTAAGLRDARVTAGNTSLPDAQAGETADTAAVERGTAPAGGGGPGAAAGEVAPDAADEAGRASAARETRQADAAAENSATQQRGGRRGREGSLPRAAEGGSGSKNLLSSQQDREDSQEVHTSSNAGDNTPSNSESSSSSSSSSSSDNGSDCSSASTSSSSSTSGRSSNGLGGRRVRIAGSWTEDGGVEGVEGGEKRGALSSAEVGGCSSGANEDAKSKHTSLRVFSHVELPPRSTFEDETDFALLQHPFVLDAANKAAALKRQASLQQFSQARRVELDAFFSLFLGDQAASPLDHSPFLDVTVRRDHIVQDTLQHLDRRMNNSDVLKKALRVHFAGEEGVDEGGVRKEFFQLLIQELFSSGYDMFLLHEESHLCWFNPVSTEDASSFRLIGIIFGLAIYNGVLLDVHFPLVIFKKLLSWPSSSLEDLEELQPTVARSLRGLLTASAADLKAMDLTFSIELDRYGERVDIPLSDKYDPQEPVTVDNCADYVSAYVDFVLNKAVEDSYRHFHEGFHRCVDAYTISLFRPEELQQVILGSDEQLNFESLQSGTLYQDGFTAESETVKAFWEVAHALSSEQKKKLLMFVTGSDRVPIKGLASLRLIIGRNGADSDRYYIYHIRASLYIVTGAPLSVVTCSSDFMRLYVARLPTAHTCFNFLLLPDYKKKEKLDRLLKIAIENCKGFGLR